MGLVKHSQEYPSNSGSLSFVGTARRKLQSITLAPCSFSFSARRAENPSVPATDRQRSVRATLETLAEAADIGLVYLGEIERGIKMPSLKTFIKLVNALDVSADELIGLETKSGRDYYAQKLSEQMQSLTQEETAAVLSILETTIQQVKKLRTETT